MSKYIAKSRTPKTVSTWSWSTAPYKKEVYVDRLKDEKDRIDKISLEDLTYKDIYAFPLRESHNWVYDTKGNIVFQFDKVSQKFMDKVVGILNGEITDYIRRELKAEAGELFVKKDNVFVKFITIRGWGNLTGSGAYNLSGEKAAKIQDSFSDFILEKLAQ